MRSGSRGAFVSEPFGSIYADCYDVLYQEKDYEAECDLIERLLRTYGDGNISSILDLGCGTGNHAIPLSARGFEVIGVDRSASMLAQARKKAARSSPPERDAFYQADIQSLDLGRQFDAALLLSETEEEHTVRYFFPLELELFLESTGFTPVRLAAFPEFERDADEKTWNVLAVARVV